MPKAHKAILTAAGWSSSAKTQTITVTGVLADEAKQLIMPMPASASQDAYAAAGIACTAQGANSLTFRCQTDSRHNGLCGGAGGDAGMIFSCPAKEFPQQFTFTVEIESYN